MDKRGPLGNARPCLEKKSRRFITSVPATEAKHLHGLLWHVTETFSLASATGRIRKAHWILVSYSFVKHLQKALNTLVLEKMYCIFDGIHELDKDSRT